MRVVLYDRELHEPLTVITVPQRLAERAMKGEPIWFAPPVEMDFSFGRDPDATTEFQTVTIRFEKVRRSGETLFWIAYPDDPELALKLRATFLPGQIGELQRRDLVF